MGIIHPPWITKERFTQNIFNYCDHFGDKIILAETCRICTEDLRQKSNDRVNAIEAVSQNLAEAITLLQNNARHLGVDLSQPVTDAFEEPNPEQYAVYRYMNKYGRMVGRIIEYLPLFSNLVEPELFERSRDVLTHSEHFVSVKIARSIRSLWVEHECPTDDLYDSKTSALFVYMALQRNAFASEALAQCPRLFYFHPILSDLGSLSFDLAKMIRAYFFPQYPETFEETGCDDYYACFRMWCKRKSIVH